jgi:hypothetical protein
MNWIPPGPVVFEMRINLSPTSCWNCAQRLRPMLSINQYLRSAQPMHDATRRTNGLSQLLQRFAHGDS